MKKTALIIFIFSLFCDQKSVHCQSNVLQVFGSADLIYSKDNSVSTSFFPRENGNLQLKNVFGYGLTYLKSLDSKNSIFLKVGIENKHQKYAIDYFSFYPEINNRFFGFDFTRQCVNLRVGILKQINFSNKKLNFGFGVDLLSRNYRITFARAFNIDAPNFANSNTTFFSFDTFSKDDLWPIQVEASASVGYVFNEKLSIFSKIILSPRESLKFNYNVTSVNVYLENGIHKKQIHIEEKLSNTYMFRSFRFNVGLSYSF